MAMSGSRCLPVDPSNAKINAEFDKEEDTVANLRALAPVFA